MITMSKHVRSSLPYLQLISKTRSKQLRRLLIREGGRPLLNAVSECALNCLRKNLILRPNVRQQLRKRRSDLIKLAQRSTPIKCKQNVVQRGGHWLPLLISAALPILEKLLFPLSRTEKMSQIE